MELIVGGKAQGKLQYALEKYNLSPADVTDGNLNNTKIIYNLQDFILNSLKNNTDPQKIILDFIAGNPDCIVICNEVGCGLVPIDTFERNYRDQVGHICCELAGISKRVHRVTCGIGAIIKNV